MRLADLLVLVLFLLGMAGMGIYFARRSRSTEAYFLGERAFPGWAIGLSMLGTSISSVTFLALPAAAFILDYRQLTPNLMMPVVAVIAAIFFIPFFREIRIVSAYEYLEQRYGAAIRLYAAGSYVVLQSLRLATILYLVSIPVAEMLGLNLGLVVAVGGVVVVFYTATGGIEAVVWTDVVQTIILLAGGILCVAVIAWKLPGGVAEVIEVGAADHKFSLGPLSFGFGERTLPVLLLLGMVNFGTEYLGNQSVVQKYLAARSLREARKATLICAGMSIPTWLAFFFVGTCLYVFYRIFPQRLPEGIAADAVLPHFILNELAPGIAGLVIAACLAAAMSTLSAILNSVSSILTVDFVKRFSRNYSDALGLRWARIFSYLIGVVMIAGALVIDRVPRESITDFTLILGSVLGGGMFAIFILGFLTRRVGNGALWWGMGCGLALNLYLLVNTLELLPEAWRLPVHPYWTTVIVNVTIIVIALAAALILPCRKPLPRLTMWTRTAKEDSENE